MQLLLGLSPHQDESAFAKRLAAAGWIVAGADSMRTAAFSDRTAKVFLLADPSQVLPSLLTAHPEATSIIAYRPLEDELALGLANGLHINAAAEAAFKFAEQVLHLFRRNRKRLTLVKLVGPGHPVLAQLGIG